jgi:uncharacterized coiled-coil protein SlyX
MSASDSEHRDSRIQETEIRLAFLDKELEEYKEAVHTLHTRLEQLEKTVEALKRHAQRDSGAEPETPGFSA